MRSRPRAARPGARLRSQTERVDAIITDLAMPGMPGLEFMRHVRERDPELPHPGDHGRARDRHCRSAASTSGYSAISRSRSPPPRSCGRRATPFMLVRSPRYDAPPTRHVVACSRPSSTQPRRLMRALDRFLACGAAHRAAPEAPHRRLRGAVPHARDRAAASGRRVQRRRAARHGPPPSAASSASTPPRWSSYAAEPIPTLPEPAPPRAARPASCFSARSPLTQARPTHRARDDRAHSLEGIPDARSRVAALKELGFRIALDDMGAGYAGLTSFAMLEPSSSRSTSLVRNVDSEPMKQTLIRSIVGLARTSASR